MPGYGAGRLGRFGTGLGNALVALLALLGAQAAALSEDDQQVEQEGVTLYRAVSSGEAADIVETGTYRIAGASAEFGKYFYPTEDQAQQLVANGWASQVTSAVFPRAAIEAATKLSPAAEGAAYFIDAVFFPHGPVDFL